jgi:hypothetical protein
MRILRTHQEIEELVALARMYCSLKATEELAKREGRLSAERESALETELARMSARIEQLKNVPHRSSARLKKIERSHSANGGQNDELRQHTA